jgi:hypothetical protein
MTVTINASGPKPPPEAVRSQSPSRDPPNAGASATECRMMAFGCRCRLGILLPPPRGHRARRRPGSTGLAGGRKTGSQGDGNHSISRLASSHGTVCALGRIAIGGAGSLPSRSSQAESGVLARARTMVPTAARVRGQPAMLDVGQVGSWCGYNRTLTGDDVGVRVLRAVGLRDFRRARRHVRFRQRRRSDRQ